MRFSPWIYRAPAIGWGFFILYACLAPADDIDPDWDLEISDKLVHFILYFSWVILLYFGSSRGYGRKLPRRKVAVYWAAAVSIGVFIEYAQDWMGLGRSADLYDAVANSAGAVVGVISSRVLHRLLE
jgi:VanZ family protein